MTHRSRFLAFFWALLLAIGTAIQAGTTIPAEIEKKMKKGKTLYRVWTADGFDATKGFQMGKMENDTEEDGRAIMAHFPPAVRRSINPDSPYVLNVMLKKAFLKTLASNESSARLEIEGVLVDADSTIVAAFTDIALERMGAGAADNARLAVRAIAYAFTKDLFPKALDVYKKGPEQIASENDNIIGKRSSTIATGTAVDPWSTSIKGVRQLSYPGKTPATASETPATPEPIPAHLIPENIAKEMKYSKGLDGLWLHPDYDKARGFRIKDVRYQVETRSPGIDRYLPDALAEMAKPDAPYRLQLRVVELMFATKGNGVSSATVKMEGILTDEAGQLMAAFEERAQVQGTGDNVDDCRAAAKKILSAMKKDLLEP